MDSEAIRARIESFETWHYQFELGGLTTPIFDQSHVNRHEQRRRYLLDPLSAAYGGSLAGRRVLDIGTNAGWWALEVLERGASYVFGIDGRPENIEQARFVFDVKEVDPAAHDLATLNVFDAGLAERGPFQIVLCLGLLMHVSKPVELFEQMDSVGAEVLVIDTSISALPGPYLHVARQSDAALATHAVERELRMLPTRSAIEVIARDFGYSTVVLKPEFDDWDGCRDYRDGLRRGFICVKDGSGLSIDAPSEPLGKRTAAAGIAAWARGGVRKRLGR
jgi:SAM-dependent methyltransferase